MDVKNLKILLVGSGPASSICLDELVKYKNLDITVIDNSILGEKSIESFCAYNKKFKNSSRISEKKLFDLTQKNLEELVTKNFGGLSTVWGSAINELLLKEKKVYIQNKINIEKYFKQLNSSQNILIYNQENSSYSYNLPEDIEVKKILEKVNLSGLFNIDYSKFLINYIDKFNLTICDLCGSFRSLCSQESLWSSTHIMLENIKKENVLYLPEHKLISFTEENNEVFCNIQNDIDDISLSFDYIFIGAGAFATSEIFLNSEHVSKVEIDNSDLVTIPFVKSTNFKTNNFSHPVLFVDDQLEDFLLFSQIYLYSDNLLKIFLNNHLLSKLVVVMPKILKNLFGGMRIFVDPDLSSKLILTKESNKIQKKIRYGNIKNQEIVLKSFINKFKKVGIFPLNIFKKHLKNGKSYHFGGQFKMNNQPKANSSDSLGRVGNLKRSFVIDSSVLPIVNTGPITYSVMANSLRITSEFIKKFINHQ
jgi:hypothetical protein